MINTITNNERKVIIIAAFRAFGVYNSRLNLIKKLIKTNWNVIVLTNHDKYSDKLKSYNLTILSFPFCNNPFNFPKIIYNIYQLTKLIKSFNPTIIHTFNISVILYISISSLFLGNIRTRYIYTFTGLGRSINYLYFYKSFSIIIRLLLSRAYKVIFQNQDDLNLFLDYKLVETKRSMLINGSGVDLTKFTLSNKNRTCYSTIRIGMLTRLIKEKGILSFIDIAKKIYSSNNSVCFYIAGEYDPSIYNSVNPMIFDDYSFINYLGNLTNVTQFLQSTDVFIYPSLYREGVPRSILEASAVGIPTIAYDIPGVRDAIINGSTGFLIQPGDFNQFIKKLHLLIDNHQLRNRLGINSRTHVVNNFDMNAIDSLTINIYNNIILEIS